MELDTNFVPNISFDLRDIQTWSFASVLKSNSEVTKQSYIKPYSIIAYMSWIMPDEVQYIQTTTLCHTQCTAFLCFCLFVCVPKSR